MHVTCTRCAKSSESFDPPAWPEGWEGSVSEAVCPGCQYVEWHPLCEGIVDFGGRRVDRNGFEPRTVKTTSGPLELERPRLRNASELGFCSRILGKAVTRGPACPAPMDDGTVWLQLAVPSAQ